jgi:transcriptional regulator with XRE-family HTH domain
MAALSTEDGVDRPHTDFGARIREERLSLRLTQEAFARQLGVHRKTQGNYESGAREPDAAYLAAASKAGVDIGYVLRGERASGTHQSLLHLVSVIFDALLLATPYKKEFDQVCRLAYEENLALWRGEGIKEEADRATVAIIKKSPLFLEESVLTDLVERLEFVLESKAIMLTPAAKARSILHLYLAAKARDKPLDMQTVVDVIEENR